MLMDCSAPLSSKLGLTAQDGFALAASRQSRYAHHRHVHDCAMLLWPRTGALASIWGDGERRRHGRLVRGQALLVPAHVEHSSCSDSAVQQHGELYFAPELLRDCAAHGLLVLDGAAQAMLEALWKPAMSRRALPRLVDALVAQLATARQACPGIEAPAKLARQWLEGVRARLADGRPAPAIAESAGWLGVSTRTLQRACLDTYGRTPVALRRMLVAYAARARIAQGESVAWVSTELGFANSGHLGRLLRAVPASEIPPL